VHTPEQENREFVSFSDDEYVRSSTPTQFLEARPPRAEADGGGKLLVEEEALSQIASVLDAVEDSLKRSDSHQCFLQLSEVYTRALPHTTFACMFLRLHVR